MSSGFISEKDITEARQRRQEEWEKVRTQDQPEECPEEPYDGRSLYERLREQKMKKDMDYEEAHKLKNLIRGLDDDEVQFLELVDQNKIEAEKKQLKEEAAQMREFRNRVATLQEESAEKKIQTELKQLKSKPNINTRPSQKALLGIGIKRKQDEQPAKKESNVEETEASTANSADEQTEAKRHLDSVTTNKFDRGALKCVAVLPGIGPYNESSDSEISTGSEEELEEHVSRYDLVGRKIKRKKACDDD